MSPVGQGRLDEDDLPRAAALLAAVTDPVPVGAAERPWAHRGRVGWRAAVLVGLVFVAYLPALVSSTLLDGEGDAFRHQPVPDLAWADVYRLPASLVGPPPVGTPPLLRLLVHLQSRLGNGPLTYRASGVLLHAIVTVLLWLALRRLGRAGGWLAAAAFAVWPGSAAAVEWLVLRGRPWAAVLAVGGCWLLLKACGVPAAVNLDPAEYDPDEHPGGWRRWLGHTATPLAFVGGLLLLLAAALCQPTVATLGLVVVCLVAWRRGLRSADSVWAVPVLAIVAAAAVAAWRMPAVTDPAVASLSAVVRPFWRAGHAVRQVAWPLASADLAAVGTHGALLATAAGGVVVVAAPLVLAGLRPRVGWGPAVAAACFVLLLPTAIVPPAVEAVPGLTPPQQANGAATYLIIVPVLVVSADAAMALARRARTDLGQRVAELSTAAAAVVGLAVVTTVRAAAFDDTETILKTAVAVNGRSWDDRGRLAEWFLSQKRPEPAGEAMVGLTLAGCPDAATAVVQGDLVRADGDLDRAMAWYRRSAELSPDAIDPVVRQSSLYLEMNRVGDAIDTYEAAIVRHPRSAALRNAFGEQLVKQGDLPLAVEQFRRSLEVEPESAPTHVNLASALATQGKFDDAAVELREAVRIDPEDFDAFHLAGQCLQLLGDSRRAAQMLYEAVRLRPDSAIARSDLSVALIRLKKYKQAEGELKESLRLQPDFVPARKNLAICLELAAADQRRANISGR